MHIEYRPKGVCSQLMSIDVEDGKIKKVEVKGRLQRQSARHFSASCGDAGRGSHSQNGGYTLRI